MFDAAKIEAGVRLVLEGIGEDASREGLLDTPSRVARAYKELTEGMRTDPEKVLTTAFSAEGYDEMVTLRDVPFYSLCEHHMLPFTGLATLSYIPRDRVVGLSKLARLVEAFARRLQIQERMTAQIGATIESALRPRGYGVVLKATHLCMCARGVGKPGAEMVTTAVGGILKEDEKARNEFIRIAGI